jgi:hypothetical protein
MKKLLSLLWSFAKAAITVTLIAFIVTKIDFSALRRHLDGGGAVFLFLGTLLLAANGLVVGVRWWLLLRRLGIVSVSAGYAIAATYVSVFVGQVLPGVIGADAVRGWLCYRRGAGLRPIVLSLVTDRLLALFALCLVAAVVCYWQFGAATQAIAMQIAIVALILIAAGLAALWLLPALTRVLAARFPRLQAAHELLYIFRFTALSRAGAFGLLLSGVVIALTVSAVLFFARGFGVALQPSVAYLVVPVAVLFSSLPISFGGWGVREASLSYGLTLFGMASDDAALMGLAFGIGVLLSSLPGAVVMLALGDQVWPRFSRAGTGAQ